MPFRAPKSCGYLIKTVTHKISSLTPVLWLLVLCPAVCAWRINKHSQSSAFLILVGLLVNDLLHVFNQYITTTPFKFSDCIKQTWLPVLLLHWSGDKIFYWHLWSVLNARVGYSTYPVRLLGFSILAKYSIIFKYFWPLNLQKWSYLSCTIYKPAPNRANVYRQLRKF